MRKQIRYPTFSLLVQKYRERRGLSIAELHRTLQGKYYLDDLKYPTLVKYESGERAPKPRYVMAIKHCLKLTEAEFQSLVDALIGDYSASLYQLYENEEKRLIREGAIENIYV